MGTFLLGIDWADEKHDACLITATGEEVLSLTFLHTSEGITRFRNQLRQAAGEEATILCALEGQHGLLVPFLLDQGWTVYPLNPKAVDRYRDRIRVSRVKSDRLDARLLADILRTDRHLHRPLLPDSEQVHELRELTRDREALVQERTRIRNQLETCLKEYWPESLRFLSDLTFPWVLTFLSRFPTHAAALEASQEALQALLRQSRHPQWKTKGAALAATLREPHLPVPGHRIRAKSRLMLALVSQLEPLVRQVNAYDKEIERLLRQHPDGQLFLSLPGAGPNLAARMLAEIGDNRLKYVTANSLQCDAGTAPITQRSGKTKVVRFRWACKKPLRHALQLYAYSSLRFCAWARELYGAQRGRGSHHQEAVRVVANRWVKIIFAIWQSHTLYDESRYLADRTAHQATAKAA